MKITYMKLNTCSKVLFVLLVVIIVLAIIIFIIHNYKRETFDLGESIDHLVDGAIGSVSDTMDDLSDSDALVDIEYNNAPIYINTDGDLHAYEKEGSHHGVEITSGDAVPKHNNIQHNRRGIRHKRKKHHVTGHHHGGGGRHHGGGGHHGGGSHHGGGGHHGGGSHHGGGGHHGGSSHHGGGGHHGGHHGGGHHGGGGHHHGGGGNPPCINCKDPKQNLNYKNIEDKCVCNDELKCKQCDDCKWCISGGVGTCIPKHKKCKNKPSPKKKKCKIGNESTEDVGGSYGTQGCNLYKNYKKCLTCPSQGKCGVLTTDSNGNTSVSCGLGKKDDGCMGHSYDKNDKVWNCLNTPDDDTPPGFGCPNNKAPFNPKNNNNKVC